MKPQDNNIVRAFDDDSATKFAMSKQQRRFTRGALSESLKEYRELVSGSAGWLSFGSFELYNLLFCNLAGLPGYAIRRIGLPPFLSSCAGSITIGRGVTVRQPNKISLGRKVIIDDYCVLDCRASEDKRSDYGISIGDRSIIGRNSIVVSRGGKITLGNAVNISSFCRIGTFNKIEIGDSVLIASFAYIGPANHGRGTDGPIIEQEMEDRGGVKIGANSWIGARATILDGVTIGNGAIVGAHSLVREDVPERSIVAGTPARVIGMRE